MNVNAISFMAFFPMWRGREVEMRGCSPVLFCYSEQVLSKSVTQTEIETRAYSFNLSLFTFTQCSRQTLLSFSRTHTHTHTHTRDLAGWCGNSWVRLYKYSPLLESLFPAVSAVSLHLLSGWPPSAATGYIFHFCVTSLG